MGYENMDRLLSRLTSKNRADQANRSIQNTSIDESNFFFFSLGLSEIPKEKYYFATKKRIIATSIVSGQ